MRRQVFNRMLPKYRRRPYDKDEHKDKYKELIELSEVEINGFTNN